MRIPRIKLGGDRHTPIFSIARNQVVDEFPNVNQALRDPDGLLAAGGDLSPERLLEAYRKGIFPWYEEGQPILWWSPDPRLILYPEHIKISRSLRKTLSRGRFAITMDKAFPEVIRACAVPRKNQSGTWLTRDMIDAYSQLHRSRHAHSVECWCGNELVGGLYGVVVGKVFFGESMFSRQSDASKACLVFLTQWLRSWRYKLIDCQVKSEHLQRLGAKLVSRAEFMRLLDTWCARVPSLSAWHDCDVL